MPGPISQATRRDIDTLWAPATRQFGNQIAVRVADLIADLPEADPATATRGDLARVDRTRPRTTKGARPGSITSGPWNSIGTSGVSRLVDVHLLRRGFR